MRLSIQLFTKGFELLSTYCWLSLGGQSRDIYNFTTFFCRLAFERILLDKLCSLLICIVHKYLDSKIPKKKISYYIGRNPDVKMRPNFIFIFLYFIFCRITPPSPPPPPGGNDFLINGGGVRKNEKKNSTLIIIFLLHFSILGVFFPQFLH